MQKDNLKEIKQQIAIKHLLSGQSLLYKHYTQEQLHKQYEIPSKILENYKQKTAESLDHLLKELHEFSFPDKPLDIAELPDLYQYQQASIKELEQQNGQTEKEIIEQYNSFVVLGKQVMEKINSLTCETLQSDEIKIKLEFYSLIYQNIYLKQKVMETEILESVDFDELKECGLLFDYYIEKIESEISGLNLKLKGYENLGLDFNEIVDEYSVLLQENEKLDRDLAQLSLIK
ncbi:hypothetical protein HDV01_000056 [Terramyces sp. JEL0728]|nr:hypothetical protein HDV01_000056 [Terramyces sp. JEL0728]